MLENKKHVFWQAFALTILFFSLGLVFGVYIEQQRADNINTAFYNSEAFLYDSFALENLLKDPSVSCETLKEAGTVFADKIYEEARQLEKFDESNKLTDSAKIIHRKYDLLRTLLWMNLIDLKKRCDANTVVYLYVYDTEDVELKAEQIVWSRILQDLKEKEGSNAILIPIAIDSDLVSLKYLLENYNVSQYPAVIINEKDIFYEHKTSDELGRYL